MPWVCTGFMHIILCVGKSGLLKRALSGCFANLWQFVVTNGFLKYPDDAVHLRGVGCIGPAQNGMGEVVKVLVITGFVDSLLHGIGAIHEIFQGFECGGSPCHWAQYAGTITPCTQYAGSEMFGVFKLFLKRFTANSV